MTRSKRKQEPVEQGEQHRHYFEKQDGVWTCSCGIQHDKHGKLKPKRPLRVV